MVEFASSADLSDFGSRRESARNLLHYLALRRVDLRQLQRELADLGLSSLGRAEGHALHTLEAVLAHLGGAQGPPSRHREATPTLTPQAGRRILDLRTRRLLGPAPTGRRTRIMVTLPSEAATDYRLVRDLIAAGMDEARINCAHDSEAEWARMITHIRRAERELGRSCRVEMDLAGPKLRTGPLAPGPAVVRVRPARDEFGRVVRPGRVWLTPSQHPEPAPAGIEVEVKVPGEWLAAVAVPGTVRLTDARDADRRLELVRRRRNSCEAEVRKTVYLAESTVLVGRRRGGKRVATQVGPLPRREPFIRLQTGDRLLVTPSAEPPTEPPSAGAIPEVSCTLPEVLPAVQPGHRIWFDDGKIGGVVERTGPEGLRVRVTSAAAKGARLRADRGINLPDSELEVTPLTDEDRRHLPFIARHADLVGYSFVRAAADVRLLRQALGQLGNPRLGVVLKIETRAAFEELPAILLEGLRGPPTGVMIARGDLAVEVGYERLAELQEEILWLCEAAHIPVIWATEVLAGLAKTGVPTRAEVTDAAMGERAECVMLNKGPHIVEAVRALDGILRRMEAHQEKKSARLRHLAVADRFLR
jgi:pyruvate kinase